MRFEIIGDSVATPRAREHLEDYDEIISYPFVHP